MTLWLKESGATETWSSGTSLGFIGVHAYGGTRMGNDPESSVTNKWCISHECPNLAIGGASNYPTTSHHHPTETHQALAWRTAEYIGKNWKSITA
jgi:gluconate 2-dehydrogenase alpha chain